MTQIDQNTVDKLNELTPESIDAKTFGEEKYELINHYEDGFVDSEVFDTIVNNGFRVINIDFPKSRIIIEDIA